MPSNEVRSQQVSFRGGSSISFLLQLSHNGSQKVFPVLSSGKLILTAGKFSSIMSAKSSNGKLPTAPNAVTGEVVWLVGGWMADCPVPLNRLAEIS